MTSCSRQSRGNIPAVSELELQQLADLKMVLGESMRQDVSSDSSSSVWTSERVQHIVYCSCQDLRRSQLCACLCMPSRRDSPNPGFLRNTEGVMKGMCVPFLLFSCTGASVWKVRAKRQPVFWLDDKRDVCALNPVLGYREREFTSSHVERGFLHSL